MNDHQDSENYSYERTWEEIETLLNKAEREQNKHLTALSTRKPKSLLMKHMRNYKGLEGVINALRWVLGDLKVNEEKVLGREKNEN